MCLFSAHFDKNFVLNSHGLLVTPARTPGLSNIQGDLAESGKGILKPFLLTQMITQVKPKSNI